MRTKEANVRAADLSDNFTDDNSSAPIKHRESFFLSYLLMAFFKYCFSHLVSGLMQTSLLLLSLALQRRKTGAFHNKIKQTRTDSTARAVAANHTLVHAAEGFT